MLRTKCIFAPRSPEDGLRASVMSRHTLSDGKTPDERIQPGVTYDIWLVSLAPPPKLVGAWYREAVTWDQFDALYELFLEGPDVSANVEKLAVMAEREDVTILCVEETCKRCHRRLLAEHVKSKFPQVELSLDL